MGESLAQPPARPTHRVFLCFTSSSPLCSPPEVAAPALRGRALHSVFVKRHPLVWGAVWGSPCRGSASERARPERTAARTQPSLGMSRAQGSWLAPRAPDRLARASERCQ